MKHSYNLSDAIQDEPTLDEPYDEPEWMQLSSDYEEDDIDQNQTKDVSPSAQTEDNQKKDPFAITVGPITKSKSKKRIQKMVCIIQNIDIED